MPKESWRVTGCQDRSKQKARHWAFGESGRRRQRGIAAGRRKSESAQRKLGRSGEGKSRDTTPQLREGPSSERRSNSGLRCDPPKRESENDEEDDDEVFVKERDVV